MKSPRFPLPYFLMAVVFYPEIMIGGFHACFLALSPGLAYNGSLCTWSGSTGFAYLNSSRPRLRSAYSSWAGIQSFKLSLSLA